MQMADHPICDFCSGRPSWCYPARSFVEFRESLLPQVSEGDWLACDECAALIERNEYEKLARRALQMPTAKVALEIGMTEEEILSNVRRMQRSFREHRTGRVHYEAAP